MHHCVVVILYPANAIGVLAPAPRSAKLVSLVRLSLCDVAAPREIELRSDRKARLNLGPLDTDRRSGSGSMGEDRVDARPLWGDGSGRADVRMDEFLTVRCRASRTTSTPTPRATRFDDAAC